MKRHKATPAAKIARISTAPAAISLINGGVLVTNPIPEEYSLDEELMNKAINEALAEAKELNIKGKESTPFLLAKVKEITKGESLASNIQLVYNNCALAAKIAKAYIDME